MVWQVQIKPLRQHAARVAHDSLLVAVVAVPPRRVPEEVVRITGAERAHYDVVQRRRVLGNAQLAKSAGRNVQPAHRLATFREQRLLKGGIDPGAGDDARTVPGAAAGEEGALLLAYLRRHHGFV